MALRLTSTTPQPGGATDSPSAAAPSAEALGLRARGLLAAGELQAFAALFAQAAEHPEPQRRYQARIALLQEGLGATASAAYALATKIYATVADLSLGLLESAPSEPVMLNCAGVACYELWSLDGAQSLFRAAKQLDPGLANIDRNLAELARRKRTPGRPRRPLHPVVPTLARRAHAVAERARPATGQTLSLCMIVRDEEQMLPRCLEAVAPFVDEIVIVDTGSTDATIEIARSFDARVIEHAWSGSFAEPRNISFDAATCDWILYLDADEVLVAEDGPRLRELLGRTWREALYLVETSYCGELGEGAALTNNALRLFRNRPGYRFAGRLHEQILPSLPTYATGRFEQTAVRILHYGYLGSVREAKDKSRRNLEILRTQLAESPPTPFLHFNLGSEYAAAGDPASAVAEFEQARSMVRDEGNVASIEYVPLLMVRLVKALQSCGRITKARQTAAEALELFPDLTDLVLAQAEAAQALGDEAEATKLYRRCIELGDAPSWYGAVVGGGTFLPRFALAQRHLDRGEVADARKLLAWCVDHHPDFLGVAGPYAMVLLRDGVAPDEVVATLERFESISPRVRLMVAAALAGAGAASQAEEQYRLAVQASPANAQARVALAESLLKRGAWNQAAQHARLVPDEDPHARLACRIELCGVIGLSGPAGGHAALERAERVGVPSAERHVFRAWAAIADGADAPDGLSVGGMPILGVILETLLGAGDTERFAALLPALTRSRLPRREQRQLLADMYLARGMTTRAAREWMAVCSEAPDSRALLGLAKVAAAHGMAADAATFATGALELDPDCVSARELLERMPAAAA
ncbi:MAG: glycosyltransferase [Solirubrobacteraceae bacterium]